MPTFYEYTDVLLGSQTTAGVGGGPIDYRFALSGQWSYSGSPTSFVVEEAFSPNSAFNGDPTNEVISNNLQIGGSRAQTVNIGGIDRQVIWDYTFTVSNGSDTWRIAVIDVDLDNSDLIDPGAENGYFLVFPDGLPPANTNLTIGPIIENDRATSHAGLGGTVVCFAAGTLIETVGGPRPVERLVEGDLVLTRDDGPQPLRWIGITTVPALDELAPVVISKGVLGNDTDLVLSPQHGVLLSDWRAQLYCGAEDVLVRAIDLIGHDGVYRHTEGLVTYCHILFDKHQLVSAAGVWSESLFPGDVTRKSVGDAARAEIERLFPDAPGYGPKAARCLRKFEARCLHP
jgi:hypothetical protein